MDNNADEIEREFAVRRYEANPHGDWTYSQGCGCQVTFFAESDYHTSQMEPGEYCTLHTARHQGEARDAFVAAGRAALAEYRHVTETIGRYLRVSRHGNIDLYSVGVAARAVLLGGGA